MLHTSIRALACSPRPSAAVLQPLSSVFLHDFVAVGWSFFNVHKLSEVSTGIRERLKKMECPRPNCKRVFSTKYNLARHELTQHQKVHNHYCQFCFRAFSSKQNRLTHEYRHRTPLLEAVPDGVRAAERYETSIPQLTGLLSWCTDPDLRPFSRVVRIYYWPVARAAPVLPALSPVSAQEPGALLPRRSDLENK